jgi:hypothetical protein
LAGVTNERDDRIECQAHGPAGATFVCRCLVAQPVQRWHCDFPDADHPWPDAWCDRCNEAFEREGEWNERNEGTAKIALLCQHCYEGKLGASVERLRGRHAQRWERFVADCHTALADRQQALVREFALDRHARWDYNQAQAELVFSNDGVAAVKATIECVGTLSTSSDTWLWSWANLHTLPQVRSRITTVRERGERDDFPRLTVPKWPADVCAAEQMAAVAVVELGARGFYRVPYDHGFSYLALTEVRAVN